MAPMPPDFVSGLKTAATSPYAYVSYVCLLVAWAYVGIAHHRLRRIANVVSQVPSKDRAALLAKEYNVLPRSGLSAEQWIRARKHMLFFWGFLALVVAGLVLTSIALTVPNPTGANPSSNENPAGVRNDPSAANLHSGLVLAGIVQDESDSRGIREAEIRINKYSTRYTTEDTGNFRIVLPTGMAEGTTAELHITKPGYLAVSRTVILPDNNLIVVLRKAP